MNITGLLKTRKAAQVMFLGQVCQRYACGWQCCEPHPLPWDTVELGRQARDVVGGAGKVVLPSLAELISIPLFMNVDSLM